VAVATDEASAASSSLTPPATIDGTGLTTSVPLLIKNGKQLSGVELQVTGTAATGLILRDSAGTLQGQVGLAVSAGDWATGSAANDVVFGAANGNAILKAGSSAGKCAALWSFNNTGVNQFYVRVDDAVGVKLGFAATHTLLIDAARITATGPFAIDPTTSLSAVSLAVAGDPNTGNGAFGGADTYGMAAGGVEAIRAVADAATADTEVNMLVRRNVGAAFTLQRVSMGAADSGGAGFKLLRVPN
jgi:hypothetical protein